MNSEDFLVHSRLLPTGQPSELLSLPREQAGWEWISFFVRRLAPEETREIRTEQEEVVLVLLGGRCGADWGEGKNQIGKRSEERRVGKECRL